MAHVAATATPTRYDTPGLGPKKTFFVLVTVVGCIAILWPKVFYPMLMGGGQEKQLMNDYRGSGCCDVVLDSDEFANVSSTLSSMEHPKIFRKNINLFTGEISIRQERPLHMHPDAVHPAMRERGRAIPSTPTVPIIEKSAPSVAPGSPTSHIVDGRPRPMPNLPRPPMGAGAVHQATGQKSTNTMGFVMPLYTIGIVSFFIYTLMKIVMKKSNTSPYPIPPKEDPTFTSKVFSQQEYIGYKRPDNGGSSKLVVTAIQGLIDAADEQLKRQENGTNMSKNSTDVYQQNGQVKPAAEETLANGHVNEVEVPEEDSTKRKKRDLSSERATVKVLGMEMTASCEGGHKWSGRPPTPNFTAQIRPHSPSEDAEEKPEPQSIFLEGALPHESQILVADSAVTEENVETEDEEDGGIVLSSKMTLSLISLDPPEAQDESDDKENQKPDEDVKKEDEPAKQEE
ncbi:resistance to inhibitors of cholinesterase protein 3 isoform X5 [Phlebotomus papatasi]|uniref:resistance to inhibitors of cholinesterase protein 3 isoform X5 n=1 Tax=Phlebotomus papatasi TaxID=29031 RepID=UPI002483D550|nr:resistance to inhibitors of cholinesterase protein 3 isoform X5 [Phlebotomus papatasi]XP_055707952.1 resistance to inhibitors of cholinesterase protein 3 isoform X5 [Phlebotomus papatasi]XP_055707953.1 resistance to inhibitors of cholinesterase protein 3 isoform X5 [Phlebotomus papatasi]XP_055707954.1 resistance to inhibitors of cholinesterase protein 3 isoform X5 [Phlebotomus papatasi]